jgi:hypothetical protein
MAFFGGGGGAAFFCAAAATSPAAVGDIGLAGALAFIRAKRCWSSFTCELLAAGLTAAPVDAVSIPKAGTEMPARAKFDAACGLTDTRGTFWFELSAL